MPKFLDVPQWYESNGRLYEAAVPIINPYTKTGQAGGTPIAFKLNFPLFPGDGWYIGFYWASSTQSSASDYYFGTTIFEIRNSSIDYASSGMILASVKNGSSVQQASGGYFTHTNDSLKPTGDQNIVWGLDLTDNENFVFFKIA